MGLKKCLRHFYRYVNTLWLRKFCGYNCINPYAFVMRPFGLAKDVRMGAYSHLSPGCKIGSRVSLGNYVMCGPEVNIGMGEHRYNLSGTPIIFSGRIDVPETIVEDDVWLGARVMIRAGVRIGRGAVVGMGAVVVKDVEPYTIVAGVPARKISNRFSAEDQVIKHDAMLDELPTCGSYCEKPI